MGSPVKSDYENKNLNDQMRQRETSKKNKKDMESGKIEHDGVKISKGNTGAQPTMEIYQNVINKKYKTWQH